MHIHVRFRPRRQDDRTVELPEGATVADLMAACEAPVDVFVAVRAGQPISEMEPLVDGEELLLLSAASGG